METGGQTQQPSRPIDAVSPNHSAILTTLHMFHKVAVDPTGTFVAVCTPGVTKLQVYKMATDGRSNDRTGRLTVDASGANVLSSSSASTGVSLHFLCETSYQIGNVADISWAHPTAGLVVAVSCMDKYIHIYELSRSADGVPVLNSTARAPRAFSILSKEVALAVACSATQRPTPLLAMALVNGDVSIHRLKEEKREQHVHIGSEALDVAYGVEGEVVPPPMVGMAYPPERPPLPNAPAATAIAWCPSLAESGLVLVVGFSNSVVIIAKVLDPSMSAKGYKTLLRIDTLRSESIRRPITSLAWAPPLGKRTHSIAACGGGAVAIADMCPQMGLSKRDGGYTIATLQLEGVALVDGLGAAKVDWSKKGDALAATCAGNRTVVLSRTVVGEPLSWRVVEDL